MGYALKNTVTEFGTVSRGVCSIDAFSRLLKIDERTHIEQGEETPRFSLDEGETWEDLSGNTIVSMNLWGFSHSYLQEAYRGFSYFLSALSNPQKSEYYLPSVADALVNMQKAQVSVLQSQEKWYGITYPEDRPSVVEAIATMTQQGIYPENLWE